MFMGINTDVYMYVNVYMYTCIELSSNYIKAQCMRVHGYISEMDVYTCMCMYMHA